MKIFWVNYRDEFFAEVEADDESEAVKKFKNGEAKIKISGELHQCFFEVTE